VCNAQQRLELPYRHLDLTIGFEVEVDEPRRRRFTLEHFGQVRRVSRDSYPSRMRGGGTARSIPAVYRLVNRAHTGAALAQILDEPQRSVPQAGKSKGR